MSLYFWLMLLTVAAPFALSFDRKVAFYKLYKSLLPSIVLVAAVYIGFDIWFTKMGVWGFNPRYHSDFLMAGLPVEEWLFFFAVPYASIFLHQCIVVYFPRFSLSQKAARILAVVLFAAMLLLLLLNLHKAYTVYMALGMMVVLVWGIVVGKNILGQFFVTFLAILLPFVAVNAILTGTFIDEPVVWYNQSENLTVRFMTIPIEDFGYGFSLILFSLLVNNWLRKYL